MWLYVSIILAALTVHALFMKYLFNQFRRKVYLDVMDFLIEQNGEAEGENNYDRYAYLRLVTNQKNRVTQ